MEIVVNGEQRSLPEENMALEALLKALGIDPSQPGIAVALNLSVVRKADWEAVLVKPGDEVDVITARQGG